MEVSCGVSAEKGETEMGNAAAIFDKQRKEVVKNKEILIQFVMFPVLAFIMEHAVKVPGLPEHYFVRLFASMYIGMAPLTVMAAVISEEKEKNTLRVLMFSGVRPAEYLLGTGGCVWMICMAGAFALCLTGQYRGMAMAGFMAAMGMGILTAMMIGAVIGMISRNQMMATSIGVPVMLLFAFLPMLAQFNEKVKLVAAFTYSGQVGNLLAQTGSGMEVWKSMAVISANMAAAVFLFGMAYRKGWPG